jgi:FkbM family methyltransferase
LDEANCRAVRISRDNAVYWEDTVNSFEFYYGSAEPIRARISGRFYDVVDFSTPRYQRVTGFDDFPILCPSMAEPFVTVQQYLEFAQLGSGQVAIDLGSYSGLTSIAFSKAVGPLGKVVALEPDPINFAACKANLAQHWRTTGLDNVSLLNAAVSARKGSMLFSSEGNMGSAAAEIVGDKRGVLTEVESLGLSDIASLNRLTRVDFVKVDIEGGEVPVLRGSEAFFREFRPRVIVEPHFVGGVLSDRVVHEILSSYGYDCSTVSQADYSLPLVKGLPRE